MNLMNEHLHQRIAELEAQLAERAAEVKRLRTIAETLVESGGTRSVHIPCDGYYVAWEFGDKRGRERSAPEAKAALRQAAGLDQPADLAADTPPVSILYTNWRGETAVRNIIPRSVRYAATEWHPEPQYLVESWDVEKGAMRSFALKDFGGRDEGEVAK